MSSGQEFVARGYALNLDPGYQNATVMARAANLSFQHQNGQNGNVVKAMHPQVQSKSGAATRPGEPPVSLSAVSTPSEPTTLQEKVFRVITGTRLVPDSLVEEVVREVEQNLTESRKKGSIDPLLTACLVQVCRRHKVKLTWKDAIEVVGGVTLGQARAAHNQVKTAAAIASQRSQELGEDVKVHSAPGLASSGIPAAGQQPSAELKAVAHANVPVKNPANAPIPVIAAKKTAKPASKSSAKPAKKPPTSIERDLLLKITSEIARLCKALELSDTSTKAVLNMAHPYIVILQTRTPPTTAAAILCFFMDRLKLNLTTKKIAAAANVHSSTLWKVKAVLDKAVLGSAPNATSADCNPAATPVPFAADATDENGALKRCRSDVFECDEQSQDSKRHQALAGNSYAADSHQDWDVHSTAVGFNATSGEEYQQADGVAANVTLPNPTTSCYPQGSQAFAASNNNFVDFQTGFDQVQVDKQYSTSAAECQGFPAEQLVWDGYQTDTANQYCPISKGQAAPGFEQPVEYIADYNRHGQSYSSCGNNVPVDQNHVTSIANGNADGSHPATPEDAESSGCDTTVSPGEFDVQHWCDEAMQELMPLGGGAFEGNELADAPEMYFEWDELLMGL